ncbi:MAG: hypothetical protein ACYSUF_06905 [Planctomycetota bacterium]|jgi:type VI protein secretion system component VasF
MARRGESTTHNPDRFWGVRSPRRQRRLAVAVWMIHLLAFLAWFLTFLILEGGP